MTSRIPFKRDGTPGLDDVNGFGLGSGEVNGHGIDTAPIPEKKPPTSSDTRLRSRSKSRNPTGKEYSLNDEDDDHDEKHYKRRKEDHGFRKWHLLIYLIILAFSAWAGKKAFPDIVNTDRLSDIKSKILKMDDTPKQPKDEEASDGICRFVSPIAAYHRDLKRLRQEVADKYNFDIVYPSNLTHLHQHSHSHKFSSTGHLLFSTPKDGDSPQPHPIPLLLSLGEKRWESLLSSQSRTLKEAVEEYKRRYGRLPPKGFDVWWDLVKEYDLVLPDEYDRINLDLAPFFALPKDEMKRRMKMVQEMKETFTLVVKDGEVDVEILDDGGLEWDGTLPRAEDAISLVEGFAPFLPNLNATFSIFDQPQIYLSWARRGSLVALGLRGDVTTHLDEADEGTVRLSRSCSPESNLRRDRNMYEGRSLIYDPLEAGDLCQNPYLAPLHGLTIEPHLPHSHPRPHTQLLPLFSLAKTSINSDILITPLDQFFDEAGRDYRWEDKQSSKLAWRGSPTGISMMSTELPWRNAHRIRLHHWANNRSKEEIAYAVPDFGQPEKTNLFQYNKKKKGKKAKDELEPDVTDEVKVAGEKAKLPVGPALNMRDEKASRKTASNFFLDVRLAGAPLQCDMDDGTCLEMKREIDWAPIQRSEVLNRHKFLLDIDGNGWSARFRRLMSTNSLVIKIGIFTEWFQPHLIPWFMYVPAKLDFSDLFDILAFFRGTPHHPNLGFDETAKSLAQNGKCFVERMFRAEDLQAYMMRLFLEYARIAADEGVDMDFHYVEREQKREDVDAGGNEAGGASTPTDSRGKEPIVAA